ncbi:MAG: DUF1285 domain-containing protein [Halioglobus sp.]|nr:DUF1285 domain-containing protein [Halioglobus sp.]
MSDELEHIEQEVNRGRNFDEPPLHLWDPALSGDIPIRITRDGEWYHDGGRIERESLVRLFASILRREEDGEYYLVTPVEKWRIEVDMHPLLVTDVETVPGAADAELQVTLNTGKQFVVSEENPLFSSPRWIMLRPCVFPTASRRCFPVPPGTGSWNWRSGTVIASW